MPADLRTADRDLATLEAGLDVLETVEQQRTPWSRRLLRAAVPPLVAVAVVLGIWQLAVVLHVRPPYVLPSPGDVFGALAEQWRQGNVLSAVWTSVHRAALGFVASLAIGTPIGLVVSRNKLVRSTIAPVLSALQSLPSVAWVPAAIIWFGLSDAAIYFVVLLGAVPSIANGTIAGLDQVPPLNVRVGRVLGAQGLSLARFVLLPSALPAYLSGLKQGWAFSWRSLMAAELITRSPDLGLGLGQLLDTGRQLSDMSLVVASVLVILAVGMAVELGLFGPVERRVLRRRGLTERAA